MDIDWGSGNAAIETVHEAVDSMESDTPVDLLVSSQRNALVNDLMEVRGLRSFSPATAELMICCGT